VAFYTLGCKLNQYETEAVAAAFRRRDYEVVDFDSPADAYVINTCTVTSKADRKSRNIINRAKRAAGASPVAGPVPPGAAGGVPSPAAGDTLGAARVDDDSPPDDESSGCAPSPLVVVAGCYVENHRERLERESGIRLVGNDDKSSIDEIVDAYLNGEVFDESGLVPVGPSEAPADVETDADSSASVGHEDGFPGSRRFSYQSPERVFHTRATLKIQDGCDNFCSFCIIPHVRGRAQSRLPRAVLDEARRCLDLGYRELVITGVNMGRYEYGDVSFSRLLERILEIPGDFRVRVSSLEPDRLDDRFLHVLGHPKMGRHLHLCLQSGSDSILEAMRREYSVDAFTKTVEQIRSNDPGFNLTTDVIVGFPGETEEDFRRTAEVVRNLRFSHVHTFTYARRSGTPAARKSDQVSESVKSDRSAVIREIAAEEKRRYREGLVGSTERLLVERVSPEGQASGYGERYVPLLLEEIGAKPNDLVMVRITGITDGPDPVLVAELAE
jgi:threonylcarbamoyladenosine tRNA methylthiotransferase MtaB